MGILPIPDIRYGHPEPNSNPNTNMNHNPNLANHINPKLSSKMTKTHLYLTKCTKQTFV